MQHERQWSGYSIVLDVIQGHLHGHRTQTVNTTSLMAYKFTRKNVLPH